MPYVIHEKSIKSKQRFYYSNIFNVYFCLQSIHWLNLENYTWNFNYNTKYNAEQNTKYF